MWPIRPQLLQTDRDVAVVNISDPMKMSAMNSSKPCRTHFQLYGDFIVLRLMVSVFITNHSTISKSWHPGRQAGRAFHCMIDFLRDSSRRRRTAPAQPSDRYSMGMRTINSSRICRKQVAVRRHAHRRNPRISGTRSSFFPAKGCAQLKMENYRSLGSASFHGMGGLASDCASPTKHKTVDSGRRNAIPAQGASIPHIAICMAARLGRLRPRQFADVSATDRFPSWQSEPCRKAETPRLIFHAATVGQSYRTWSPRNALVTTITTGSSRTCLPTSVTNAQLGAISAEIRFVSQGASKAALSTCVRWAPAG